MGFWQSLNYSSLIELYDLIKLALSPWGGYNVILTPFCNTEIGKLGVGIEVNHNLKSGFIVSRWDESLNYSTSFSNEGIQEAARWQFCNKTQAPFASAPLTRCYAFIPWPWPKDIDYVFFSIYFANFKKSVTGSEPGDSKKIKGV